METSYGEEMRGINIGVNFCDHASDWTPIIKSWGCNFAHFQMSTPDGSAPQTPEAFAAWIDAQLARFDLALAQLAGAGIKVSLALYTPPGGTDPAFVQTTHKVFTTDWAYQALITSWQTIATRYRGDTRIHSFDPLNEPAQTPLCKRKWPDVFQAAAQAIHAIDPARRILLAPRYANAANLGQLQPILPTLKGIPITLQVHCYDPQAYTYQGINGAPASGTWPDKAKGWNAKYLTALLKPAADFQAAAGLPLIAGEFSAARWADGAAQYLNALINVMEANGWGWAYHCFRDASAWDLEAGDSGRLTMLQAFWNRNKGA